MLWAVIKLEYITLWLLVGSQSLFCLFFHSLTNDSKAMSGACATIASDALMNPFDGTVTPQIFFYGTTDSWQ